MISTVDNPVANFVQKTFQILRSSQFYEIIHWMQNGFEFIIKSIQLFEEVILPKYFRHRNVNSFIRQLNIYSFHKSRREPAKLIFSHPYFLQGREDLLGLVRRKIKTEEKLQLTKAVSMDKSEMIIGQQQVESQQKVQQVIQAIVQPTNYVQPQIIINDHLSFYQFRTINNLDLDNYFLKSLISKSIIQINTDFYQIHYEQTSLKEIGTEEFLNYGNNRHNSNSYMQEVSLGIGNDNAIRIFETKNYIFQLDI